MNIVLMNTLKEDLLFKFEFRKLYEILDVDSEVFSVRQQRPSVNKNKIK